MRKRLLATVAALVLTCSMAMPVSAASSVMPDGYMFDAEFYAANYPDAVAMYGTDTNKLYAHYRIYGINKGYQPYAPGEYSDLATATAVMQQQADPTLAAQQNAQIVAPSQDFVISRLANVSGVMGIEAVTKDHDPNGGLSKANGYTSAVYFLHMSAALGRTFVTNDSSIVGIGTQGGGCIETYATAQDAVDRATYLFLVGNQYNIDVGSYVVLGTMVIRTSEYMPSVFQEITTQNIINSLMLVQQ